MNRVFVDTSFITALVNEQDEHHARAIELADLFDEFPVVTTDAVLLEIGNALARGFRDQAREIIADFLSSEEVEIVHLNPDLFRRGFELYGARNDKSWGMVDCISFVVMSDHQLLDALTTDRNFAQAGFNALMRV